MSEVGTNLGWEVVVRFPPGAGTEAQELLDRIARPLPEQAQFARLDKIVAAGEERQQVQAVARSGARPK